jgi:hypothetical protein
MFFLSFPRKIVTLAQAGAGIQSVKAFKGFNAYNKTILTFTGINKSEIRISKLETNPNYQNPNNRTHTSTVLNI